MSNRPGLSFSHVGIYVTRPHGDGRFLHPLSRLHRHRPWRPVRAARTDRPDFLSRDPDEHHQIVMATGRPADLAFNVVNQISLRADSLNTLKDFHARLKDAPISEMTPVTHGNAASIYFRDPEKNRLELFIDTPQAVTQPMRVPLPIEMPEPELMNWIEGHARRRLPGFRPRSEWPRRNGAQDGGWLDAARCPRGIVTAARTCHSESAATKNLFLVCFCRFVGAREKQSFHYVQDDKGGECARFAASATKLPISLTSKPRPAPRRSSCNWRGPCKKP